MLRGADRARCSFVVSREKPMVRSRGPRRLLVTFAFLVLAGCARAPGQAAPPALVGAWRSQVRFEGGILAPVKDLEFLYVFNAGGTMTESSNYDASPPVPPAYGEWRPLGENRFEARYTFFTTNPPADAKSLTTGGGWLPAGSGVLTERITVAADGRSYDAAMTLELFDPAGKPVAGGGAATVHAVRAGF
jgi:hypothetical protein